MSHLDGAEKPRRAGDCIPGATFGFRVVGGPARFTISGSATGEEPNNFADLRGGFEPGSSGVTTYAHIEPGTPPRARRGRSRPAPTASAYE